MPDQPVEFWATFEGADESDSRTYLDEQSRMRWTADDRLTVFTKTTYNREFAFTGKTGANAGGFRQVSVDDPFWSGYDVDYNYAIYPHAADNAFDETDCFFTATLPAEQTYVANSFGPGANTMVAVSESGQLLFKNVCSYLRVMLYGADQSVKKITLSSIADEALAGEAKIYASLTDDPTCTMVGTTSSIVLNCEEAITVNTTEEAPVSFWIVVPPVTLSKGYKVTVENAEGETQEFAVDKVKTFARNIYSTLKRELKISDSGDLEDPQPGESEDPEEPEVVIPNNEIWYTSSDNTMIEPSHTGESVFGATITSHTYNNGLGVITFSGDVTKIGNSAFYDRNQLTSITIPNSVTEIGNSAFYACHALTSITIPDGVTTIGNYAFYSCQTLTSITIPNSVTKIGENAFYFCDKLTSITIPDSVTEIEASAFSGCASLSSITIPDGVTEIGESAFEDCSSLTSITIPNSVTKIGENAFDFCDKLNSITIPNGVTTIGDSAFSYCRALTSITIPNAVTTIGSSVFTACSSLKEFKGKFASSDGRCLIIDGLLDSFAPAELTSYTIPSSVTKIGKNAFSFCDKLNSITIPEGVTAIGNAAFSGCLALTSITIPEGVTEIGNSAFYSCSSLTSITIPNSLTTTGGSTFYGCSSLKEFKGKFASSDGRCLIIDGLLDSFAPAELTSYTIPSGVTAIGNGAFFGCSSLTSITIPEGVTTIGHQAFIACYTLASVYCKATTPPTLGNNVFLYNATDRKIYVPASDNDSIIKAYKAANNWCNYRDYIVEYKFK